MADVLDVIQSVGIALTIGAGLCVVGFLSLITGGLLVPEAWPHWLRLLAGFAAIMFVGACLGMGVDR